MPMHRTNEHDDRALAPVIPLRRMRAEDQRPDFTDSSEQRGRRSWDAAGYLFADEPEYQPSYGRHALKEDADGPSIR